MALRINLASYCLCYLAVCLCGYAVTASFEIERGKHDTFRNAKCQLTSQPCTSDQCQSYKAECVDNKCQRCRCSKDGRSTFVTSGSNKGNCTKDENIIPESGCYHFQMLNVDSKVCRGDPCSHQFTAPILSHNKNCRIHWSKSKILNSTAATWQSVSENIDTHDQFFSIQRKSNHTQMLHVSHEATEKFSGSLFRLAISCKNEMHPEGSENQCLLLKFEFLPWNTKSKGPGAESNAIAIVVPVSLLTAILVRVILFYFVCYRRQKREQKLLNDSNEEQNQPSVLVPPARIEPLTSKQPSQYEVPCERQYEYVDKKAFALPQIPFTYEYATVDKALKHDREAKVMPQRTRDYVIERSDTGEEGAHDGGYVIERPDTGEEGTHDGGYVIERSDTGEEGAHDGGYVIERPDSGEEGTHDGGYVIERSDTGEEGAHDGGYVIERSDTGEEGTHDGGYVIERSDTGEEGAHDGGYVIERPDTGEEGAHDGGYVIERSDTGEEDTHDGGYVIERPDTGEEGTHDNGYVIERSDTEEEGDGYVIERSDNEGDPYDRGYVITRHNIDYVIT